MKTVVLILAAGPAWRGWTDETPKQLALIASEPLILRTIRQLRERGYDENVTVVTNNKAIQAVVPRYFEPESTRWLSETRLSTQELWAERTIMLSGDVIFSPRVMDAVVAEPGPLRFIDVDKIHVEAFVFTKEAQDKVRTAARVATKMGDKGMKSPLKKHGKITNQYLQGRLHMAWAFYRSLLGMPLETILLTLTHRKSTRSSAHNTKEYKMAKRAGPEGLLKSVPELLPMATVLLETICRKMEVFEYGSGGSTLWLAERAARVTSIEDDPAWHAAVWEALLEQRNPVTLLLVPTNGIAKAINGTGKWDIIFVDCRDQGQRVKAILESQKHLKPKGWLVIDDSNFPKVAKAVNGLRASGWEVTEVSGKKIHPVRKVPVRAATAFCRRPTA